MAYLRSEPPHLRSNSAELVWLHFLQGGFRVESEPGGYEDETLGLNAAAMGNPDPFHRKGEP